MGARAESSAFASRCTIATGVFAGTVVESGALDIQTEKVGGDTTFSRIIALVENAEALQAPVQKLADKVAAWLIPIVFVFLIAVYFYTRDVRMIVTLLILPLLQNSDWRHRSS